MYVHQKIRSLLTVCDKTFEAILYDELSSDIQAYNNLNTRCY